MHSPYTVFVDRITLRHQLADAVHGTRPNCHCLICVKFQSDNVFVRCVSVCLSVCSGPVNETSLKATDFKFDMLVSN